MPDHPALSMLRRFLTGALSPDETRFIVILRQSQSRYPEAVTLAVEALQTFTQLRVQPQVEEALNILVDSIQARLVTAVLLESVADFVRRAEHDRRMRYHPRFE